jgi:hypothetical protein
LSRKKIDESVEAFGAVKFAEYHLKSIRSQRGSPESLSNVLNSPAGTASPESLVLINLAYFELAGEQRLVLTRQRILQPDGETVDTGAGSENLQGVGG